MTTVLSNFSSSSSLCQHYHNAQYGSVNFRELIHRLTYRRTNHDNVHVRRHKEENVITISFDMTVLNDLDLDLDRFHLVMDTIYRIYDLQLTL